MLRRNGRPNPRRPDEGCDRRHHRQADRERRRKRVQPAQARQGAGGQPTTIQFPLKAALGPS